MYGETLSMNTMDINQILSRLPHRYPFLLVDKVVEFEPGKTLTAIKNVSVNEPCFTGHFPEKPVMPGVLIIEALAQATCLLSMETNPDEATENALYLLVGVDKARFKRPVLPGDQLQLKVELLSCKRSLYKYKAEAIVDGKVVASAEIMCTPREL
jgi:3-hydroxyacyl-[acyl-carrier-protein] dehydratase